MKKLQKLKEKAIDASIFLAIEYENQGFDSEAEIWYRNAAELGSEYALERLFDNCEDAGDQEGREHWAMKGAQFGYFELASLLGREFASSDPEKSMAWHRIAAEAGSSASMVEEGLYLAQHGQFESGRILLLRAAEMHNSAGNSALALLYEELGQIDQAIEYYRKAAAQGDNDAYFRKLELEKAKDTH